MPYVGRDLAVPTNLCNNTIYLNNAMEASMRILAVTPWVPSLRRPRSFGLLKMASEKHDLFLVAGYWNDDERNDLEQLPFPVCGVRMRRLPAILRAGVALGSTKPLQQAYLNGKSIRQAISRAEHEFRPDLLYFNTLRSAQWRSAVVTTKKIIDLDEFRSAYFDQVSQQHSSLVWRSISALEARRMRREETEICNIFDRVLVSSPTDAVHPFSNIDLVRSPDALAAGALTPRTDQGSGVVFIGRMSYAANVDAIDSFARLSWPTIKARCPESKLSIVGDAPGRRVTDLASESVRIVGRVPDVTPYYRAARVSIVPVTAATGVQMKLIESLRLGVPTVVTPLVAKQAGVTGGREVLVASSVDEWTDAVSLILRDDTVAAQLGSAGAAWAASAYSSHSIRNDLLTSLSQVAND